MKVLKQFLALTLSLCLATPGWAQTASPTPFQIGEAAGKKAVDAAAARGLPAEVEMDAHTTKKYAQLEPEYSEKVGKCKKAELTTMQACRNAKINAEIKNAQIKSTGLGGNAMVDSMKNLSGSLFDTFVAVSTEAAFCASVYARTCEVSCIAELPAAEATAAWPQPTPAQPAVESKIRKDRVEAQSEMVRIRKNCANDSSEIVADMNKNMMAIATAQNGVKKGMSALLAGGLGLAAGAGAVMLLKGGGKKESEEDKKAAADKAANGVIKDANGNEITCFSPESYAKAECKSTLISLCQGSKGDTAGCRAFEAAYCANEGSGSGYCLYAEAKVYCAQSGDMISSSPACSWKSGRPASCTSSPEDVSCLVSGTPEALTLSCANYPNDPLCKANASGRVVVQGGTAVDTGDGATSTSTPVTTTASLGSSSMSSVIGGGSALTAQSAGSNLQVIAGENMWSTSSSAVQKACATGQLLNCL